MGKLQGKVAIVTGASKGIGAAIAKQLAKDGASVIVNYSSSKDAAEKVVADIKKENGKAIAIKGDISKSEDIKTLIDETLKTFKKIDILVNNAGVYNFLPLEEVTEEEFHRMFNLNVLGLLLLSKEAAKHLNEGGSIINISSVASVEAPVNSSIYSATKAAVDTITKVLSKELGKKNIRVNSINPGFVETEGVQDIGFIGSDFQKKYIEDTALGRSGKPDDIAPAVSFLASDEAKWMTGERIFISGGL